MNWFFMLFAVVLSATAQILLKFAARYGVLTFGWLAVLGMAVCAYGISFFLYAALLRAFPISKIGPALTIGVVVLVVTYGFVSGEAVTMRQLAGLSIGLVAIYLILG